MGLLNLTASRAWVIFGPGFSRAGSRLLPAARRVGARQQMIFFSVGVPSRFAEWCDALIAALVAKAHGPADLAGGNTLEEIGRALLQSKEEHLIVSTRQLAEDLRAALANAGAPFVLSFDDPRIAVKNLIDVHGLDPIAAIRATATSCAAVLNTSMMDGALVLRADHDSADPIAAASRIAEHFHLPLGASDIAERVAAMPALPSNAEEREPAAEAAWEPVATGALDAYREYFSNHALGDIVWARDLFFWGDKPQQAATGVIDLRGRDPRAAVRALHRAPARILAWHDDPRRFAGSEWHVIFGGGACRRAMRASCTNEFCAGRTRRVSCGVQLQHRRVDRPADRAAADEYPACRGGTPRLRSSRIANADRNKRRNSCRTGDRARPMSRASAARHSAA